MMSVYLYQIPRTLSNNKVWLWWDVWQSNKQILPRLPIWSFKCLQRSICTRWRVPNILHPQTRVSDQCQR